MRKGATVVYAILLFTIAPAIAFSEDRNLIGKGASFETKSIRMKLYKNVTELSQFPEWPELNAVAVPLTIDDSRAFHGSYSLKLSPSSFQQLKSEWKQVSGNKGVFTFSCYLCADKPGAKVILCIQSLKERHQETFPIGASWERYSLTAYFEKIPESKLCCSIYFLQKGHTVWADGIQLEPDTLTPFTTYPEEITLITDRTNNLFSSNENIQLKGEVYSDICTEPYLLSFQVNDWKGKETLSGKENIMIEKSKTILTTLNIGCLPRGWYEVKATLTDEFSSKIIDSACVFISVINPLPPSLHDSFFGLHDHAFHHQFSSTMDILGAKWQRVFASFSWSVVEPSKGKWRFPDCQVEDTRKHGQEILGVLSWHEEFKRWPAWGEFTENSGGSWHSKRHIPKNLDGWEEYVFQTVRHFRGKVNNWEILNEPNGWMSADEYLPLLKIAYRAAKRANPDCTVVGISTTADKGINLFSFAKEVMEKGGLSYCDVVSFHPYPPNDKLMPEEKIEEWTQMLRSMVNQYSPTKYIPIWNTEMGWQSPSCYEDRRWSLSQKPILSKLTPLQVAGYMVRMHFIMLAAGVEKYFYFNGWTKDLGMGIYSHDNTSNLINLDDSPAPALPAYNAMVDILGGSNFVKIHRSSDGFARVYLFTSNNKYIAVAWNWKEEKEYKISLPTDIVGMEIYDIMGNQISEDEKQSDRITFILEDIPIYIIIPISERQKLEKSMELKIR